MASLVLLCSAAGVGRPQAPQSLPARSSDRPRIISPGNALPTVPLEEFQAQLMHMQSLLAACRGQPLLCDPRAVPPDEQVLPASDGAFTMRWYWLREALVEAHTSHPEAAQRRIELIASASGRLEEEARSATASLPPGIASERTKADAILNRSDFRRVQHAGYLQQKIAAISLFVDRLFSSATALIPQSPWFATLLEWALLGLAAAAVMLWAWRVRNQQRFLITAHHQHTDAPWQKESEDWAARARLEAQRGDWREAIHSLYWSAIVLLEGQKLWRQNRARTPREYVLLLDPASDRRVALLSLTRIFERIWYGLRTASEDDYQQAAAILERLRLA